MKITVCGSFGFRNAGDEAVPLALQDLGQAIGKDLQISRLCRYDKPDMEEIIGLGEKDRELRENLIGDPLLFTGGGIIEPNNHCVLLKCSRALGKNFSHKTSLFAASVEFNIDYSWKYRFQIRNVLRRFHRIYVRDVLSAAMLEKILPGRQIKVTGDSVLYMKPSLQQISRLEGIHNYIAVSLAPRWHGNSNWVKWMGRNLAELANDMNAAIVFVPMSVKFDSDVPPQEAVENFIHGNFKKIQTVNLVDEISPRDIAKIFKEAKLVVSMRLHGNVMSYAQETPFIALNYHPKLSGFSRSVNWERSSLPESLPALQSNNTYGYNFEDLDLESYYLVNIASSVINDPDFSMLEHYRKELEDAFIECIAT